MPFKPGHKHAIGRPKGSMNKNNLQFREVLEKHNFCPATAMIEIFNEAKKVYQSYAVIYEAIVAAKSADQGYPAVLEDKADKYLKIAGDMAKDLASYAYAKRKAIETTIDPDLLAAIELYKDKSDEELVAIMNQ